MCKSSMGAPRLVNVLLVLLIANFSVALSPAIHDRALLRSSSNFVAADPSIRENLAYLPARWRLISPLQLQLPEIQIQLLKSHVQEDKSNLWAASAEYKYSSQNYNIGNMESSGQITFDSKPDEKSNGVTKEGNVAKVSSAKAIPQLDMRNIIDVPTYDCPPGQRLDPNGKCRDIIQL
ncbi:uncharacterized protein LOC143368452 [Andrena cerasifolii]|uniref:uncharacterized protein LOC143368452 n=1 Tax=Andrena cerasifolii TaxID=2819439 RepID=UPI004037898B